MGEKINDMSMNAVLAEAVEVFRATGDFAISPSVLTIVADHVRAALEGSRTITLEDVEKVLQGFFRDTLAAAPKQARASARGQGDAATSAAFLLGQVAFAHLLAARTLDTRADDAFSRTLEDRRYLPYLRAMLGGPKDGITLTTLVDERPETVSRKLAVLRGRGLVTFRQEGTRVVNKLSPAAKALLSSLGVEPLGKTASEPKSKEAAIDGLHEQLPNYLRYLPVMDARKRKAA